MSEVRQYVGARYVPRFLGTYDATQQYEALDVVDNGLGTSYIARKIVPAGTPVTDTEYWFMYGASSGAIINLQNQINAINGELETLHAITVPYITDTFTDVAIGEYVCALGYNSLYDGGSGIWERVSSAIPNVTYDHSGAYYKPIADNGFINVKQMGAVGGDDSSGTISANKTLIDGIIAAGEYNGLIIPPDVNYGYNSHQTNRITLDMASSPVKLLIYDYSVDESYHTSESRGAAICRILMHTPDPNNDGQHDGNGMILTGAGNPYLSIVNDSDNPNADRASIFFGSRDQNLHNNVYNWQISQCYLAHDKSFNITKYYFDNDLAQVTSRNFLSFNYNNHHMCFGNHANPLHECEFYDVVPTIIADRASHMFLQYLDAESGFNKRLDFIYDGTWLRFDDKLGKELAFGLANNVLRFYTGNDMQDVEFARDATTNALSMTDYGRNADIFKVGAKGNGYFKQGVSGNKYASADRPTGVTDGTMIFDTTLRKPIWYLSGSWYDATGTAV